MATTGHLIKTSSPTPRPQDIGFYTLAALDEYLPVAGARGKAVADVCVLLPEKASQRDVDKVPVPGAPDLTESHDKVLAYLRNGTGEVWQIFPKSRSVQIYRGRISTSLDSTQQIVSNLLPGFSVPVTSFFEPHF